MQALHAEIDSMSVVCPLCKTPLVIPLLDDELSEQVEVEIEEDDDTIRVMAYASTICWCCDASFDIVLFDKTCQIEG